jgi:hypothetical protein
LPGLARDSCGMETDLLAIAVALAAFAALFALLEGLDRV